jgi:hypothetical protein
MFQECVELFLLVLVLLDRNRGCMLEPEAVEIEDTVEFDSGQSAHITA